MALRSRLDDTGKLLLRVSVAGLMLLHGAHKLSHGIAGVGRLLSNHGLPAFIGYGVYVGEIVTPLLMLLGLWTRPAAIVFAVNMLVAIGLAHAGDVAQLTRSGGWAIELQALYLFGAVAIALLGPGRFALARGRAWWH
jgi:putative oxidoreductase